MLQDSGPLDLWRGRNGPLASDGPVDFRHGKAAEGRISSSFPGNEPGNSLSVLQCTF